MFMKNTRRSIWNTEISSTEEFNVVYKDIYSLCSDFLNLLPAEFRSYKCLTDMNELLEGNRADTLREAYAILEVRYREERRDRETQTFRENQNYYASQQAEAQRKAAEYAKQEMENLKGKPNMLSNKPSMQNVKRNTQSKPRLRPPQQQPRQLLPQNQTRRLPKKRGRRDNIGKEQ